MARLLRAARYKDAPEVPVLGVRGTLAARCTPADDMLLIFPPSHLRCDSLPWLGTPSMADTIFGSGNDQWVCPNDRQLALRAK